MDLAGSDCIVGKGRPWKGGGRPQWHEIYLGVDIHALTFDMHNISLNYPNLRLNS